MNKNKLINPDGSTFNSEGMTKEEIAIATSESTQEFFKTVHALRKKDSEQ
tara:strand:- start:298 stop:447 length:150 start_codon:yes stop_codon:yes gene_type:complete